MDTSPLSRQSTRWAVFGRVQEWIQKGQLAPGEVIKDTEIAERLGVSRTPVREALQMLERQGLVEMIAGRQTRVTDTRPSDIGLAYATLGALNSLAAELGTPHVTMGDLDEMRAHNERLREAAQQAARDNSPLDEAREADNAFHGVLRRVAANPFLDAAVEPLMVHIRRLEALYFRYDRPGNASYEEHEKIIAAVAAGDAAQAALLTRGNYRRYPVGPDPFGPAPQLASD